MKAELLSIVALCAAFAITDAARADEYVSYKITGTVADLSDNYSLFGATSSATPFTLTYIFDLDNGFLNFGGGGFGGSSTTAGGADDTFACCIANQNPYLSPLSASLQINGQSLNFLGASYGSVTNTENSFPGYGSYSTLDLYAKDDGVDSISSQISADSLALDGQLPVLLTITGSSVSGTANFSFSYYNSAIQADATVSGSLTPTELVAYLGPAGAAPEPSTWALLLTGIGALGLMLRRPQKARGGWIETYVCGLTISATPGFIRPLESVPTDSVEF